jgi:predicted lactoylglutathione lyase
LKSLRAHETTPAKVCVFDSSQFHLKTGLHKNRHQQNHHQACSIARAAIAVEKLQTCATTRLANWFADDRQAAKVVLNSLSMQC